MKRKILAVTVCGAAMVLTACGSSGTASSGAAQNAATAPMPEVSSPAPESSTPGAPPIPGKPFGPACAAIPETGKGSLEEMAKEPVATALASNPELSVFTKAVDKADLAEKLNKKEDITVFAPTNEAFAKIPADQLEKAMKDETLLTKILKFHVVEGRKTPTDLQNGSFTTLEGGTITTSGSGQEFKVDDKANVVCGDINTKNATVYVIDSVLMPQ
ncbi:fasciclin domain-containing protein [Rhizohabitans arisaemae]|uniref:fasciclin domain-containing protein n=1 Tax=Rhizohabitans arisaemae TaxID=2720610 RepID=UPI0024B273F3|nr:fasciclin domain-containing protein [Rhizohabitans arisaemae]